MTRFISLLNLRIIGSFFVGYYTGFYEVIESNFLVFLHWEQLFVWGCELNRDYSFLDISYEV